MRSRSGIAIAYTGAALIGLAGILLSVIVFLQTAHGLGSQSSRPPAAASPRALPSTGPASPLPASPPAGGGAPPGGSRLVGGGQASRSYPPGEPPGDIEDEASPRPASGGAIAGVQPPLPTSAPVTLPVPAPSLIP